MSKTRMFGITAAALLCLSLALPDRAAAAANTATQAQSEETVTSGAAPAADESFLFADTDLSNLMSHEALATPTPSGSFIKKCDLGFCCADLPLGGSICCNNYLGCIFVP